MKKILITGGSGQLAKQLFLELRDLFSVISCDRNDLNITDRENVKSFLTNYNPDIIINTAAYTDVDGCEVNSDLAYDVNAFSINNFSDFFNGLFIQISTDYVFDGENGPYDESDKTNPLSTYGKSKLKGEEMVEKNFTNYLIIRTNVLYGGKSKASFLDWVIASLSSKKEIHIVNDQFNNPVSIYDLSSILKDLITKKKRGLFHIGSKNIYSRFDFANMIAKTWGLNNDYILPISTKELKKRLNNYVAERPMKSGLISLDKAIPEFSLVDSLEKIKNLKVFSSLIFLIYC
jgi:dTDP-4-dehydrorhamnose reductase